MMSEGILNIEIDPTLFPDVTEREDEQRTGDVGEEEDAGRIGIEHSQPPTELIIEGSVSMGDPCPSAKLNLSGAGDDDKA